ncbi:acyltransferase family protein [Zavarzinella formosa]|uniref:acyltransferase family protein n=1 Tax=Zavarzinella formosa TaxID=360055 RepID=UPI0002D6A7AE|nr:acyltransferase [Zavarzinella formosa]
MNRIPAIDTLRVFAILAVLTLHARLFRTGGELAGWERVAEIVLDHASRFAVPFFFFVAGFLFERGRGEKSRLDRAIPQVKRLLVIYLGWSLILLGEEIAERWIRGCLAAGEFTAIMWPDSMIWREGLIYGVRMHLWFLPALMQCLLVYAVLGGWRFGGWIISGLYIAGLAFGAYAPVTGIDIGVWSRNSIFFGTLFVWAGAKTATRKHPPTLGMALGLIVMGSLSHVAELILLHEVWGQEWLHERINFLAGTALVGIGVGWLALARPGLGGKSWLPALGAFTLGVYILHLDVMRLLAGVTPFHGIAGQLLLVIVCYAVTIGIVRLIACWNPARKWVC